MHCIIVFHSTVGSKPLWCEQHGCSRISPVVVIQFLPKLMLHSEFAAALLQHAQGGAGLAGLLVLLSVRDGGGISDDAMMTCHRNGANHSATSKVTEVMRRQPPRVPVKVNPGTVGKIRILEGRKQVCADYNQAKYSGSSLLVLRTASAWHRKKSGLPHKKTQSLASMSRISSDSGGGTDSVSVSGSFSSSSSAANASVSCSWNRVTSADGTCSLEPRSCYDCLNTPLESGEVSATQTCLWFILYWL